MCTILTSSYNHKKDLKFAIESVLSQTYTNFEYHLIDDGSTDETFDIMYSYAKQDKRIILIKLPKVKTLGILLNKSIRLSTSKYWLWCPADDGFFPNLLEEKLKFAKKYPNTVLYDAYTKIDSNGNFIEHCSARDEKFQENPWNFNGIGFTGAMIPMYIFKKLNLYFPEHLPFSEDFYWTIKVILHGIKFKSMDQELHYKRRGQVSTSTKFGQKIVDFIPVIRRELQEYAKTINT